MPVIIVQKEALRDLIDEFTLDNIDGILNGKFLNDNNKFLDYKFKLIPFVSLGNNNGMLLGFLPDYIKIYGEEGEEYRKNAYIGIYQGKLCKSNSYSSLVGLEILKGV